MVQSIQTMLKESKKVIGLKQTLRAIQQAKINMVYYANDTEDHIVRKITETCTEKVVPLIAANLTKKELGRFCQIEVGAAVIGILK